MLRHISAVRAFILLSTEVRIRPVFRAAPIACIRPTSLRLAAPPGGRPLALLAEATSSAVDGVSLVRVPILATVATGCAIGLAPAHVDEASHRLQMRRVETRLVPTRVVELQAVGNWANEELVRPLVRERGEGVAIRRARCAPADVAVTLRCEPTRPEPANVGTQPRELTKAGRELRHTSWRSLAGHTAKYAQAHHASTAPALDMNWWRAQLAEYFAAA